MILLASIFNWSIAIAYVLVGIVLAVLGGTLIGRAKMENNVEAFVLHNKVLDLPQEQLTLRDRLNYAREQVAEVIQRVWLYVLIGVGIGAAIHNWIPEALITTLLGEDHWWSVPLAALVGVPMYADIFGTLPIAEALVAKGIGLGTALAFMMALTSSPPSRFARSQAGRAGTPTVFSPTGPTHLGGFLLLAALPHRSLHRRTGRVPPLAH